MLRSMRDIVGYPVVDDDGKVGKVVDILFGDRHWKIRFLDVETKTGFRFHLGRSPKDTEEEKPITRVLIKPSLIGEPESGLDRRRIPTLIPRDEIKECPSFASHESVEDKYDIEFRRFFRESIYSDQSMIASPAGLPMQVPMPATYEHTEDEIDEHLKRMKEISGEHVHSTRAVLRYHVRNEDKNLGYVTDLILDTETWEIAYLILDTRHGIPSKKYLVPMSKVESLNWSESSVAINIAKDFLTDERRYRPYDSVNMKEGHEYDYYGKPCLKELMGEYY